MAESYLASKQMYGEDKLVRTVRGTIVLPARVPSGLVEQIFIEIRDVSFADAPSTPVAKRSIRHVTLRANGRIPFEITAPDVEPNRILAIYIHMSLDGSGVVRSGDLLTTRHYAIPNSGSVPPLEILVTMI